MHDYWIIQTDNKIIPSVEELDKVINALKVYRDKIVTLKKA